MGGSCSCSVQNIDTTFEVDINSVESKLEIQSSPRMKRKAQRRMSSLENTSNRDHSKFIIVYHGNSDDFETL